MSGARRTALVGFGNVAERGHLPGWLGRSDFRVVAVADPDPRRRALAARLLPGTRVHASASDLFRSEDLDVVDIATPPLWHAALAAAASAAGCHVLCEKPLATSRRDREILVAATRSAGVALFTVHNWKHSAPFGAATALLAEGAIGRLVRLRLETLRTGAAVAAGPSWRRSRDLAGGGILVDHGWHAFYLLVSLAGRRPTRISARMEREHPGAVEHTAECTLDFGALAAEIHLTWAAETRRTTWSLEGTDGTLVVEDDHLDLRRGREAQHLRFPRSLSADSHHSDWFAGVIDDFVREIEQPALRGRNLAEADLCLTLTRLAYESDSRDGCTLRVPAEQAAGDARIGFGASPE
jgi:predicted dehydrogenase